MTDTQGVWVLKDGQLSIACRQGGNAILGPAELKALLPTPWQVQAGKLSWARAIAACADGTSPYGRELSYSATADSQSTHSKSRKLRIMDRHSGAW